MNHPLHRRAVIKVGSGAGQIGAIFALTVCLSAMVSSAAAQATTPLASVRDIAGELPCRSEFLEVAGRPAFVLLPRKAASTEIPWVWYAPTFATYPNGMHLWMFRQFLENGIAVAGMDIGESYGNPTGRAVFTAFADRLRKDYALAQRACLMPQSRGGLMLYNWAAENPQRVACIAGIYTVCDLRSYPGLAAACTAYGMNEASLAWHLAENNPIDRLGPLAKAGVPILHVHGDSDAVVPLGKNSGELAARYRALGGTMRVIVIPGKGHEEVPEFFRCQELVDFVIAQARARRSPAHTDVRPGVKRIADIEYARVNGVPLLLDVYTPENTTASRPSDTVRPYSVAVWIHGGGWNAGDKTDPPIGFLASKGFAVVSIRYRFSGIATFPAQIHDCKAAIRWIRAHAGQFGFDPQRIGVAGISAGGHLAALLGTSGDVKELEGDVGGNLDQSSRVQAVCDFCGPTDFTRADFVTVPADTQPSILEDRANRLLGGAWQEKQDVARLASPVYFISSDPASRGVKKGSPLPAFLIVHGDADPLVPLRHSQLLYDKLKGMGAEVTLHVVNRGSHVGAVNPETLKLANQFFDRYLKDKGKD